MLSLAHVLFGVQPKATRQIPHIPSHWAKMGFTEVVIDSREVVPGALFVALRGDRTDGHNFLAEVLKQGACGALVHRDAFEARRADLEDLAEPWVLIDPFQGNFPEEWSAHTRIFICVDDPLMALQRLAVYHRRQFRPTVIGITGSVGKTSTKEVLANVLSRRFCTLKSKRSYNSEATVPTTLLQLTADHDVAVLEMGTWAPGEIRFLADLAQPSIGIVTNIGPSHLERMGSLDEIENAKAELIEALPPDGIALLNSDDPRVARMAQRTAAQVLYYGLDPAAELWADAIASFGLDGLSFQAHYAGKTVAVHTPLIGRYNVYTALASIAAGLVLNMEWEEICAGLMSKATHSRIQVVSGIDGATILNDTYNAAPASSFAALQLLGELEGRRIAVFGDMLELGAIEEDAHRQVGRFIPHVAHELICVGKRAQWIAEEALAHGMPAEHIQVFTTKRDVIQMLYSFIHAGDYVLIKGSRGVALEEIVTAIQHCSEGEP